MSEQSRLPERPYKGLARFDDSELDERFFFGRDRETELVADNLVASRLTVLYGPSGVGKSSLLRAGVVRRLRALVPAGAAAEGDGALPVVVDEWRDEPLAAIAAAVGTRLPESPEDFADALAERAAEFGGEIYLVLDQMEEYFVYHGRDRGGPLRDALAEILSRPALRVHVLLGIRDDALAELDVLKGRVPGLFANVLRLDHLDVEAAQTAILEPLAELETLGGPRVVAEPALVAAVVDQVASGRIERRLAGRGIVAGTGKRGRVEAPYLQLVMDRLWEVERGRGSAVLRAATLAELGGAGRIVQQHLERALASLDGPDRELVARLFHQLVTPSGTKIAHGVGDLSRYAGAPPERLEDVLHTLSSERVVRALPGKNGGGARYEIYHDVLAGAVLDWRARHEAERALAEERAAARRRRRRFGAFIGLALFALAMMAALTAYAFSQRADADEKAEAARQAQLQAEASERDADAERDATQRALERTEKAEKDAIDARNEAKAALASEKEQRELAEAETERANDETARANNATADANALAASEKEAKEEAVKSRNDEADARKDAETSRDAERVQRQKSEESERRAVAAGRRAEAGELVAQAMSRLGVDPEESLQLALRSAQRARTPGLEEVLRDGLKAVRTRAVLPGGGGTVGTVTTSADGSLVLVPAAGGEARVYESASRRLVARLRHGSPLRAAVLSPDGNSVVTAGTDGVARRWDVRTEALRARFDHGLPIRAVAFSPDGSLLATAAGQGARVWRAADGSPVERLLHPFAVDGVSFSPDGTRLMTLAGDARIYRAGDWQQPPVVLDQPGRIVTARFAPTGPLVATGGRDDLAMIWDGTNGGKRHELVAHGGDVREVAWSPQGDLLATASADNGGRVFRVDTGALVTFLGRHSNQVTGIAFSPDGRSVVTSSLDGSARLWSGFVFARGGDLLGHSGPLLDAVFAPDGRSVLTASEDGSVRVWNPAVDPIMTVIGSHTAAGRAVAFSRDGSLIASVGVDRMLRIWRRNGRVVRTIALPAVPMDVAFSADGALLLTAGEDGVARIWRVAGGAPVQSFSHGAPLRSAAFDVSGERVVTGGIDGIARIWRRGGGTPRELRHGGGPVTAAVFSPGGRFVATAGVNGEGRIWRAATATLAGKLTGQHEGEVTSIAYSTDGTRIATSGADADAHIWRADTFRHVRAFRGHTAIVSDVAFSPDGRWIATAGPTTVGLWETTTGRRVNKGTPGMFLRGHERRVRSVAFAPDSRRVASVSDDGTVRTYLCEVCGTTGELIRRARARLDRLGANLTPAQRGQFLGG